MAYFRKRGKSWRAEVERRGVLVSMSGFATKGAAKAWADEREAEIMAGVRGGIAGNHTLSDALIRYRDHVSPTHGGSRWERLRLDFMLRHLACAGELIDRVTPDQLGKYRDVRLAGRLREKSGEAVRAVSGATVRREFGLLSGVFEVARGEWRWCAGNPVRSVVKPEKSKDRRYPIPPALEESILAAHGYARGARPANSTQYVGAAFALAIETAMRAGELRSLRTTTVDRKIRVAHLPKTKNGDARDVPLSKRAVEILDGLWPPDEGDHPLFPISDDSRDALWRKVRDRTPAMRGLHFHDSRHEAIKRLAKKLHVLDLAKMIGHRDPKSLMVYYDRSAADIAADL